MIAIDLSKQQALDTDPRAIQQINFTGNLDSRKRDNVFHQRSKVNCVRFFTRNRKRFVNKILLNAVSLSDLIFINIK